MMMMMMIVNLLSDRRPEALGAPVQDEPIGGGW